MLRFYDPEDVAEALKLSLQTVLDVADQVGAARTPVTLWCNKTGRVWNLRSWRAAYFRVCLIGLTDWGWCQTPRFNAWRESGGSLR